MNNAAFPFDIGTVHIIGIGGIGMSGYAEVLHHLGYAVQGSDMGENANVLRLRALGIRVSVGHDAQNLVTPEGKMVSVVVRSTAVKDDNPEVMAALQSDIPVIARVDLLAELMRAKWCVNVSGTHGKTTTTSMIGHVLERAGLDPTVVNGGIINAYGSNTRMGKGRWMVVESDESDGTFARLPSSASIITNIDPEHMDYYGTFDEVKSAYLDYVHQLPFYGLAIACIDHPVVEELLPQFHRRYISYGLSDKADIQAVNVTTLADGLSFDIRVNDKNLKNFPREITGVRLPMFGVHNVQNSLTAFALGHDIGIPAEKIVAALASFSGVKRRFTVTGAANGVTVIDDYAHHPVEIKAVLKAARDAAAARGHGRVIAVMQPHRYSRLSSLFDDFAACFADADQVIVADVYAAGEKPVAGITRDALVSAIRKNGKAKDSVHPLLRADDLPALVSSIARAGDIVVCLGAGNITQWAQKLPSLLQTPEKIANGVS